MRGDNLAGEFWLERLARRVVTLDDLTALLSRVGKEHPKLMEPRDARLLIEAIIAEGRKLPSNHIPQPPD